MIKLISQKDFAGFTECKNNGKVYPKIQSAKDFWLFNGLFIGAWALVFVYCIITV